MYEALGIMLFITPNSQCASYYLQVMDFHVQDVCVLQTLLQQQHERPFSVVLDLKEGDKKSMSKVSLVQYSHY